MWVGGVADSQTRFKPLQTPPNFPKNRLFRPKFHLSFSQISQKPWGGWVSKQIWERYPKKNVFLAASHKQQPLHFCLKIIFLFEETSCSGFLLLPRSVIAPTTKMNRITIKFTNIEIVANAVLIIRLQYNCDFCGQLKMKRIKAMGLNCHLHKVSWRQAPALSSAAPRSTCSCHRQTFENQRLAENIQQQPDNRLKAIFAATSVVNAGGLILSQVWFCR